MSEMTYFVLFGVEIFTNRSTDLENYSYKGGIYIYKYKYIDIKIKFKYCNVNN